MVHLNPPVCPAGFFLPADQPAWVSGVIWYPKSRLRNREPDFTHRTSNFSWNKYTIGKLFSVKMALNQNATEGNQMLVALEINFAGWGMIICAAMEVAQYFDAF